MGFLGFDFKKALEKTRFFFSKRLQEAHDLDEVEEILYLSDLGSVTVEKLIESLRSASLKETHSMDRRSLYQEILKKEALSIFENALKPHFDPSFIEGNFSFKRETFFVNEVDHDERKKSQALVDYGNQKGEPRNQKGEPKDDQESDQEGGQESGQEGFQEGLDFKRGKKLDSKNSSEPSSKPSLLSPSSDRQVSSTRFVSKAPLEWTPEVWMFVGVNGVGKTTSIGKLAYFLKKKGKVLIVAGDTFRAAAQLQLKEWSLRAQVDFYESKRTKDPAAVAFEACQKTKSDYKKGLQYDFILIDTAGRLTTKGSLMEELKKVKRVIQKVFSKAPQEVFVVLDANSGQNTFFQARDFHKALHVTGIIFNKLDGSAKGGVLLGLVNELKIPIYWLGVGEKKEDLQSFQAKVFVDSLFSK